MRLKDKKLFKYEEQRPEIINTVRSFKGIRSWPADKIIMQAEALRLVGNFKVTPTILNRYRYYTSGQLHGSFAHPSFILRLLRQFSSTIGVGTLTGKGLSNISVLPGSKIWHLLPLLLYFLLFLPCALTIS